MLKKNIGFALLIICIGAAVFVGACELSNFLFSKGETRKRQPVVTGYEGKRMPSFDIRLIDSNNTFNTRNIPIGKPVVFFYFGPQCPYCAAQMDEILKAHTLVKNIRFYVITTADLKGIKEFYKSHQLNMVPEIKVGIDKDNFFRDYFQITKVPFLCVYSKDGLLNHVYIGNISAIQILDATRDINRIARNKGLKNSIL